jgi:hypothetical protein
LESEKILTLWSVGPSEISEDVGLDAYRYGLPDELSLILIF